MRFDDLQNEHSLKPELIKAFLDHLALQRNAAVNTQKIVLNALVFLFTRFLKMEVGDFEFANATRDRRIPTVFSQVEAMAVIDGLKGRYKRLADITAVSALLRPKPCVTSLMQRQAICA